MPKLLKKGTEQEVSIAKQIWSASDHFVVDGENVSDASKEGNSVKLSFPSGKVFIIEIKDIDVS